MDGKGARCSFCGQYSEETEGLIKGDKASICRDCLRLVEEINEESRVKHHGHQEQLGQSCSFCGKNPSEGAYLVAGPQGVRICLECGSNYLKQMDEPL